MIREYLAGVSRKRASRMFVFVAFGLLGVGVVVRPPSPNAVYVGGGAIIIAVIGLLQELYSLSHKRSRRLRSGVVEIEREEDQ